MTKCAAHARLEALEPKLVSVRYAAEGEPVIFHQGPPVDEMEEFVTAEYCTRLMQALERFKSLYYGAK